jgi:archaellum biogenesis protein FlaJ (TadC family)
MEEFEIVIQLKDQEIIDKSLSFNIFKDVIYGVIDNHNKINEKYFYIWAYLLHISIKNINRKEVTLILKTDELTSTHEKIIKKLSNNIYNLAKTFNKLQMKRSQLK